MTIRRIAVAAALCACATGTAMGQLRIATWNVTNYDGGDAARNPDFATAIYGEFQGRSLSPDIIVGQEFQDSSGVTLFLGMLNSAANSPGDWAAATFTPANPSGAFGNALFYRTSQVDFINQAVISGGTAPRVNNRYLIRLENYTGPGAEFYIYSTHMKAGSSSSDQSRRSSEAQRIVDNVALLPDDANVMLMGDFNIQSSSQAAYATLISNGFIDPIRRPGSWQNNSAFRNIHTQDPAGQVDDRYDQILITSPIDNSNGLRYLPATPGGITTIPYTNIVGVWDDPNHSYRSWGNDASGNGTSSGLRISGNTMVGATIAQALADSAQPAGHLPVYFDLGVPARMALAPVGDLDFGQVAPGGTAQIVITVSNTSDVGMWGDALDDLQYSFATTGDFSAPAGTFNAVAGASNMHTISMGTNVGGQKSGSLTINAPSSEFPETVINLTGEVGSTGNLELRIVTSDGEGTSTDTGPVMISDASAGVDLYIQARIVNDSDLATGITTFDGQLNDDATGVYAPVLLTNTEALGAPVPGDDFQGRTGVFPSYRATIGPNNADAGNGMFNLAGDTWLFLPLNIAPSGNGEGLGGDWSNTYKINWSSADPTARTVQLTASATQAGYQSTGGLIEPVAVTPDSIDLVIEAAVACLCEFDGTEGIDVLDLLDFLALWFPQDPGADVNNDTIVDVLDLLEFLSCWFPASNGADCP